MKQKEIFMINEKEFKVPIFNITVLISLVDDLNDFVKYRQFNWKDVSEFGAYTYSKAGNRTAITAFGIVFEMSATTKSLSSSQMAKRYSISRPTAWLFMHKVRSAMKSSELNPVVGTVYVDEFVYGGKEDLKQGRSNDSKKKKIVAAVEIDDEGGIKRAYFKRIDDYSSDELGKIFHSHISTQAKVKTDKWSGYKPLKREYDIEQIKSNTSDFFQINTIIHQVKSW